jgi:hypothetical protein
LRCKATNYLIIVFILKHKNNFKKHLFKTFTNFEMTIIKFHVKKNNSNILPPPTIHAYIYKWNMFFSKMKTTWETTWHVCFQHPINPITLYTYTHIQNVHIHTYSVDAYSEHKDILAYYYPSEVNGGMIWIIDW